MVPFGRMRRFEPRWIRRVPDWCALHFYLQERRHRWVTQRLALWHAFNFPYVPPQRQGTLLVALWDGLKRAGLVEHTCPVCGCSWLSRGSETRCPPCQKAPAA